MKLSVKHIFGALAVTLLLGMGVWYLKNRTAQNIISGVVASPIDTLQNDAGRTNIVILGIGGEGHEGGDLTDSMLFVSLDLIGNTATMLGIPRDIWVPSIAAKINTAYHYGQKDLVKTAVSEILGERVHYVITLDFSGFVKAIDIVGGVDVEVERSFDDYEYPIAGLENAEPVSARFEYIHFDAGLTHMDGATALKFARSRHAVGEEGTDFARAARQEKIILAFRNQVFSSSTLFNSNMIGQLKDNLTFSVDTDLTGAEEGSLLKLFISLGNKDNVSSFTLTNYLFTPKSTKEYGGQWVLVPTPSLEDLQSYVKTNLVKQ